MPDRSDSLHGIDEAIYEIRRMVQHSTYRRRLLRGLSHDVELATLRLLRSIQRAGDPPSVGEVAEALTIDPSTASRLVDRAASSGYVERLPGTEDRRRIRLELTPAGNEVLEEVTLRRREMLAETTDRWTDADLTRLADLLSMLLEDFRRTEGSE